MSDNALWDFSLSIYGRAEVRETCLRLQDEAGVDVNLVLYLLWCAATGRHLDATALAVADANVAAWRRRVVEPLREARRAMKGQLLTSVATQEVRTQVKAAELAAERLEQDALFAAAPPQSGRSPALAELYLALYGAYLGRELPGEAVRTLLDSIRAEA